MLYLNKITKQTVGIVISLTIFTNASSLNEIKITIKEICNAPSEKRSSYFKIESKGKANLKIKLIGVSGDATLTKEEWEGVQRVFRKDQLSDNKSYRECSAKLTPILINKVYTNNHEEKEKDSVNNNHTHGEKSHIFINPTGDMTFN